MKIKSENKNTTNNFVHFLESNFDRTNRLFVLVYSNQYDTAKRNKVKRYFYNNMILKIITR